MNHSIYQVGGSLPPLSPTYVKRRADIELQDALQQGEFCYLLNCRQMGKSSLMVKTRARLQAEGYSCATVDMTQIGSENITPLQWYKGLMVDLWRGFNLLGKVNFKTWWKQREDLSFSQRLTYFVEEIIWPNFTSENLIIFIDEIDSLLSLPFAVDDFFAWIRYCYNQRASDPEYQRLSFALFGVATPSDLIQDRSRTPFNIGKAIALQGFSAAEVHPIARGLNPLGEGKAFLDRILYWSDGQPFLTQKICDLLWQSAEGIIPFSEGKKREESWVDFVVRSRIIDNWEFQDEPEHLRTIRDRLTSKSNTGRLLGVYQKILQELPVAANGSKDHMELLLSGLLVQKGGKLQVRNRIYQQVFNLIWVREQLAQLRPYAQLFDEWIASEKSDSSRLLRGQALQEAKSWARGKSLSDLDYQYLAASEESDRARLQELLDAEKARALKIQMESMQQQLAESEKRQRQEEQIGRLQRKLLGIGSIALAIAISLSLTTFWQYRYALESEIQAIATTSDALFASNHQLDALVKAIAAHQRLRQFGSANPQLTALTQRLLQQASYTTIEANILAGHGGEVFRIAFSPDGTSIASASNDRTARIWRKDGSLVATLTGHTAGVVGIAFSPDGNTIATGSNDGTIKLWQPDGTLLQTLTGHGDRIWDVSFSPDGRTLASASWDGTVKLWQLDGTPIHSINAHPGAALTVAFSPDGEILASGGLDRTIKLWKPDGTAIATLTDHNSPIYDLTFSPDGRTLASASWDETVKLWNRQGQVQQTLAAHNGGVWSVAFSPDGQFLASGSTDQQIKLWRIDGTELASLEKHQADVFGVAFSPDGKLLASGGWDNHIQLWRFRNPFWLTLDGHSNQILAIAFSPDGELIASASNDRTVKLWHPDGTLIRTLTKHKTSVHGVAFSPDGRFLLSASLDGTARLWHPDGTLVRTIQSTPIWDATFSPDGQRLLTAHRDNTAKIWQLDGTLLATLDSHRGWVVGVAVSPNGQILATASEDNTLKLWHSDGREIATLEGHTAPVWKVAFSPDGNILASAANDNTVKLWRTDGTLIATLTGHQSKVRHVAFHPDGQMLASASDGGTVKLWRLDGTAIATLNAHGTGVWGLTFSPDGNTLATGGADNRVMLWDLDRVLSVDLLDYACNWVRDYLQTNPYINQEDRTLCP
ncbi:AAA-like domain-containing protein [Phormidium sp. CCY1219]|uniref:WD40 domain-containing protein n=1 Tax=Phormidium sp. CCY1219 TaxID=2886104 RepID=UPI002D1F2542|nr:AAA-like domain-containing protein [Phormidium sp. CCY1219]MEB3826305.1 AAA-like domain-containing protein [Phormidium sp. CCY1219]